MASSDPLPGPDAKSPAFPNDFFSHELERLPALAGARRRGEMDYSNSSSEEEEAPPIFECALAELLRAGVGADVRPLLQEFMSMPAALAEAYPAAHAPASAGKRSSS